MLTAGINHVAVITNDTDRLHAFYREVFDWNFDCDNEMGYSYIDAKDANGNGISAGLYPHKHNLGFKTLIYVTVEVCEPYLEKVEQFGGKVLQPPTEIPGVGTAACFEDFEGNVIGIMAWAQ